MIHRLITPPGAPLPPLDTTTWFAGGGAPDKSSPIDHFYKNCDGINKLVILQPYLNKTTPLPSELATISILGYMSAFESYLRTMLSRLISFDEYARFVVERKTVTFGAAMHHKADQLPDALLEGTSFASRDNIKDALKEYLRLKPQDVPDIDKPLKDFQRICEMRHCCVHRFGRLGSNNAITLGLANHSNLLDASILLDIDQLQAILLSLRILVRTINTNLFTAIIERTTISEIKDERFPFSYPVKWTWRWPSDRARFRRYYALFSSNDVASPSPDEQLVYKSFRDESLRRLRPSRASRTP